MNVRMISSIIILIGLILSAIAFGDEEPLIAINSFIDLPSIFVVLGVILSGTLWSFPVDRTIQAFFDACSIEVVDEERAKQGYKVFQSMAEYALGGGILGTVIGLVKMLKDMSDPTAIGPAMAVALLTIFYGVLLSEAIFKSMANSCLEKSSVSLPRQEHRGFVTLYSALFSIFILTTCFTTMLLAMATFE